MSIRCTKKRTKYNVQKNIMGIQKQDVILKQFFQDNERFADYKINLLQIQNSEQVEFIIFVI